MKHGSPPYEAASDNIIQALDNGFCVAKATTVDSSSLAA
jgi:hypothetical protein